MASSDSSNSNSKSNTFEKEEPSGSSGFQNLQSERVDRAERSDQLSSNAASVLSVRDQNPTKMDGMLSKRADLPDDLACFLQQQKQRQARLETTMRSFPSSLDTEMEKQDMAGKRKRNTHEDPLSHRIIEKRRRDRMNNCLADLSRLIPSSYLKKGRGRIEKTEIIEMAIKHMKHLQSHPCNKPDGCELAQEIETGLSKTNSVESFRVGYHECLTETMHFLVEKEGLYSGNSFCVRLMAHLQKHYDRLGRASTSEIHSNVGRTWNGPNLPAETESDRSRERNEAGVKSEYGLGSEESGYSSLKQDEETVVNLSKNESERRTDHRNRSYSPERPLMEEPERFRRYSEQDDKPNDLSMHGESSEKYQNIQEEGSSSNLYKFKSNIRHRFDSAHDPGYDYPPEKRHRRNSKSADKDMERNPESRSYSPGLPIQSHSSYETFSNLPTHERLMVPPIPPQNFPCKGEMSKPLIHTSADSLDPHYHSDVKLSPSPTTYSQGGKGFTHPKPTGQVLPIFALNTKGSHYIPLSIDSSVIAPFLSLFNEDYTGPLHPVTISVNFTGLAQPLQSPRDSEREREWRPPRHGVIQQQSVIKHWRDAP